MDVDYTIAGVEGNPLVYRLAMSVETTEGGVKRTVACSNFLNSAWCDLTTSNGTWRLAWDANADGVTNVDANAKISLSLVHDPVDECEADYMIVDVSSGSSSKCYPVRYVRTPDVQSNQFNKSVYKTTRLVLKRVPANTFTMGFKGWNTGPYTAVYPATNHTVQLTKDYFVGVFAITMRQFRQVYGSWTFRHAGSDSPANPADERPADALTWDNLNSSYTFFTVLNARTFAGEASVTGFRLPTEAEWECACRAGCPASYTYFWWSDSSDLVSRYAWIRGSYPTRAVGRKLPNDWGLYDMCGNLQEWCSDWYDLYSRDPAFVEGGVTVDPTGPATGTKRVVRGGFIVQTTLPGWIAPGGRAAGSPDWSSAEGSGTADVGFRVFKTTVNKVVK